MDKLQVNAQFEGEKGTILSGQAPTEKPKFRKPVSVSGVITVPGDHLENPSNWLTKTDEYEGDSPLKFSYVEINKDKMSILFVEDAGFPWESEYKGKLELDPRFTQFGINGSKTWTPIDLGNFFKMKRTFFESVADNQLLVSSLTRFEAKIDKTVKEEDDGRANTKSLREQAVTSNLPKSFNLILPIFKGMAPQKIEIEVNIHPSTLECILLSPDAADYIEELRDKALDEQKERIKKLHPELRIFEI